MSVCLVLSLQMISQRGKDLPMTFDNHVDEDIDITKVFSIYNQVF